MAPWRKNLQLIKRRISEIYLTSGLVAVTYATLMFMNVFNGYLFLKTPIKISMLTGAVAGVAGVGLIFWPEISGFDFSQKKIFALCLAFFSLWLVPRAGAFVRAFGLSEI